MAVQQSEKKLLLPRDIAFSLFHTDGTTAAKPSNLLSLSGYGCSNVKATGSTSLSHMDENSNDSFPTGSINSQTRAIIAGQLLFSEISSSAISSFVSAPFHSTSYLPSPRGTLENDDTGSSSFSLSSAGTRQSRGASASHGSESSQQEDELSPALNPLANGRNSHLSSIARSLSSPNAEQNDRSPLLESPSSKSIDFARVLNGNHHLSDWNDSPFVSSYQHDERQEVELSTEQWSSQGLPWHIDVEKVVTGDMVATGSFGMVFKGIYKDEKVAVKVLLIPEASSEGELRKLKANFLQEIGLWFTLSHPNIVQFVGAYIAPPKWAIVTEFLLGGSLRAFLSRQRRRLPQATIHSMALDIARGMDYLHQNCIMHRDLKSGNLLLDENGTVKVADFGLARFETEDPGNLTAETGTIRWMAPEVICHMPYSRKIDVYSYGIVLWELCTSLIPYEGMAFVQLAHAVANDNHRPPTSDLPSSFVKLMRRCWDKDPSQRPDFEEIVRHLETTGFSDTSKASLKAGSKPNRAETGNPMDNYSRPTISLRGGHVVSRLQNTGPSYVTNTNDALSDDEEWVSVRRQCRCTIL